MSTQPDTIMPTVGTLKDGRHHLPVRVYYEDTDFGGIVYHANFLKFAERGRTEFLRCLGIDQTALKEETGVVFAARRLTIDFEAPARMDDALVVTTVVGEVTGATLTLMQQIARIPPDAADLPPSGHVLATVSVMLACVNASGRPVRLPTDIRRSFTACLA